MNRIRAGFKKRQTWSDFEQKQHALSQLKALKRLFDENMDQITAALKADLNKVRNFVHISKCVLIKINYIIIIVLSLIERS